VQNVCSKKIHKGTPHTLECGAVRNQDPFSLISARGILRELTGIYQCRNSGAEYLTVFATVLVQNACSKKIHKIFQVLSMSTKRRKKLRIHTKIAAIGQVKGFRFFSLVTVSPSAPVRLEELSSLFRTHFGNVETQAMSV